MQTTAELLDLSDLVDGMAKGFRRTWGIRRQPRAPIPHPGPAPELTIDLAVAAIDQVVARYPAATWTVTGTMGRIVAGDRLVSLAVSLTDPDAELVAWVDAAGR